MEAGNGDITITGSSNVSVNAKGSATDGIKVGSNCITIETTGTVTTYADSSGINASTAGGTIAIKNATVVNTSGSSINAQIITIGDNAKVSSTSKLVVDNTQYGGTFTPDGTETLNAVVVVYDETDSRYEYTVHGNVVVTSSLLGDVMINGIGTLAFAENSKLTINQGAAVCLINYDDIDWTNANVINNGVIYLASEDYYSSLNDEIADGTGIDKDIADLNITGDGYIGRLARIAADSGGKNYETVGVYNSQGTAVDYVAEEDDVGNTDGDFPLYLDEDEVTDTYYTWEVEGDVGTLTINDDLIINGTISITDVTSVNIVANGTLTIAGYGAQDNLKASGDLTITGDVVATGYIDIAGDLVVDGNLVAGAVFANNMEVKTGATVNLLGETFVAYNYSDDGKTYALRLSDASADPTLTLGSNVFILTSGVSYATGTTTVSGTEYNTGTFINEGDAPDFSISWYNIATAVSIGRKSSSSGSYVTTYPSTITETANGTVSVSNSTPTYGTPITVTVIPDEGYEVGSITVTTANGTEVAFTDNGDDTYSYKQPSSKVTITVTFVALEVEDELEVDNIFTDVDPDAYYYDAVMWAVENGITNGTSDTTFSPDETCTRAQAVTLLWKAYGSPVVDYINPFADVSADMYYYEAVLWAVSEGITSGTSEGTFGSDVACTRGQIVTFLYRAAGEPEITYGAGFSDVSGIDYYYSAVLWAVNNAITNGTSDTTFSADNDCTRGQIVTFLYRNLAE